VWTISLKAAQKLGTIVSAHTLRPDDDITVITREGMALRTRASSIRLVRRASSGVRIIHLGKDDQVVSVAVVEGSPDEVVDISENGADGEAHGSSVELEDSTDLIEGPDGVEDEGIPAEAIDEDGVIHDDEWQEDDDSTES